MGKGMGKGMGTGMDTGMDMGRERGTVRDKGMGMGKDTGKDMGSGIVWDMGTEEGSGTVQAGIGRDAEPLWGTDMVWKLPGRNCTSCNCEDILSLWQSLFCSSQVLPILGKWHVCL